MRISEFAARVGASVRTVTRYVNEGKFQPTRRTAGGHMRFGDEKIGEFKSLWPDRRGRPPGAKRAKTASIMLSGTTSRAGKQSAAALVREIATKRRVVSRRACWPAPTSAALGHAR